MESARRPFGRSLAKEPGLKKARITEDPAAPDRSSNGRVVSRPMAPKILKERDSESVDSMRGTYQYQPSNQLHQELVNQYKTALSELTFNSKPIITNLTIIAGENSQAAKAIAATICANVLEVPREQKLPSLYLLDSIVKNFGRDYIKHFAPRLPEVFCKSYKLVDPSTHQNMRHLFGTWKGVFPPQTLQMIEKELGLTSTANGSSSGTTTSKPDVQAQRPANSIHVNPKYLEARHRLQTTRNIQLHQKDHQVNDPVRDKIGSRAFMDPVYGSDVSGRSGRVSEGYEEQELDRPFYESGSDVTGNLSNQKNGFDRKHGFGSYVAPKSATTDSHLQLRQNSASRSWKNSEEEEYMWDEMNTGPTDRGASSMSTKNHWTPDSYERSDFESHLRQPGIDDEATTDSMSTEMGQVASGTRQPLSWSGELHPPAERMQSGPSKNISGYSEGYSTGLKNSSNTVGKPPFQSQVRATPKFAPNVMPGPKVSISQQTIGERNLTSAGPPTDPRRPSGQRNTGSRGQFTQDFLPLPSTVLPPLQQKKHVPTHKRKLEVSEFESTGEGRNLPQISGSESRNSSSDQSNPLTIDSPGQSITSSLLSAVAKSGILGSTSEKKLEPPPLTPCIGSKPEAVNSTSNPVSNLLSTLMAKGLISASKSDSLISSSTEKPNQPLDRISGIATSQSTPESSTSMTMFKSLSSTKDDMSSFQPVPKVSDDSPEAEINMKNLIGFDFRPDVVRKFQPHVVSDLLSDPPHQCTICGLRLQFQEQLDRHMDWHALKVSRTWYSSSTDWVSGVDTAESQRFDLLEESDEALESSAEMVPADESQCACILCGEMFEDFYSRERKEWMFKEAVFLTTSESGIMGPIVHVNCISEHSVHDLGLACDVKLEKDL